MQKTRCYELFKKFFEKRSNAIRFAAIAFEKAA